MVGASIGEGQGGFTRRDWFAVTGMVAAAAVVPRARDARRAVGEPVLLNCAESAFGPSPRIARAIEDELINISSSVHPSEVDALTRQIANFEGVLPEQVIIGADPGLLGLYLARQNWNGGNIIHSAPGSTAIVDAASPLGVAGRPVPLNARLENDLPALLAAIDERALAVSLVNPHHVSGTVNDAAAFHQFLGEAANRALVVVDEAFLDYDKLAERTAIRQLRSGANVLIFRTLAKAYGLAGLSIGYAVAPAQLVNGLRNAGLGAPHSLSRLNLAAASAALADQDHIANVRRWTLAGRRRLEETVDALGFERTDSRANFVYFRAPASEALRALAATQGMYIGPSIPPLIDWVRITAGTAIEVEAAVELVRAIGRTAGVQGRRGD